MGPWPPFSIVDDQGVHDRELRSAICCQPGAMSTIDGVATHLGLKDRYRTAAAVQAAANAPALSNLWAS